MAATLLDLLQWILGLGSVLFLTGILAVLAGFFGILAIVRLTHPIHQKEVGRAASEQKERERRYGTA